MTTPRVRSIAIRLIAVMLLAGCATLSAQTNSPPVKSPPARPAPVRSAPVPDSLPSPEAVRVLGRIPEPLSPAQQVPPPARRSVPAPESASDTLKVAEPADPADTSGVPVPAPTQALVVPSSATLVMPDTLAPTGPPAVAALPNSSAPPAGGACWRVQVAAPEQRAMADSRRQAAQSLLLVPMTVETEGRLHKVRTRDCLTREAADAIKRRATDSGFEGVFLVNTAAGAPATAKLAPAKPVAKKKSIPVRRRKR